ncbi:MAG: DinB family protein [Planctomycetes bacterium]|nr:DinB family protein [Planctomycetota bacterium]
MNAISSIVGHVNTHWLFEYALMTKEPMPALDRLSFGAGADPTPPPLADVRETLAEATALTQAWLANVNDALLSSKRDFGPLSDENLGTQLMRAVLHTWFHIGEINAMRQMRGHDEIRFVGRMAGQLEYGGVA